MLRRLPLLVHTQGVFLHDRGAVAIGDGGPRDLAPMTLSSVVLCVVGHSLGMVWRRLAWRGVVLWQRAPAGSN